MKWHVITLLLLSGFVHFIFFGHPREVVFDEVHFGNFASSYETGRYFFDVHPPLGKLLISAAGHVAGYPATHMDYGKIGNQYADSRYVWYRILPTLAGFLLPLVVYLLSRRLGLSSSASFFAGLGVILENSLMVQSRFIFLDIFLVFFGFTALLFYVLARQARTRARYWIYIVLSALLASLTFSVKWTGLSFLGLIILAEVWDLAHALKSAPAWKKFGQKIIVFAAIGFVSYFSFFAVHFSLLPKSGPGDAFMSPAFQKSLEGSMYETSPDLQPPSLISKFLELNRAMWNANKTLTAAHDYSSKWYSWPVMARPIYYWIDSNRPADEAAKGQESKIYLLGNPFIYWLGALSVLMLFSIVIANLGTAMSSNRSLWRDHSHHLSLFLLIGFAINWLPFIFIGRVMFLYHYLIALVFSIIILSHVIDLIADKKRRRIIFSVLFVVFASSFIFFSPFTYGLPMTAPAQDARFWFKSWI